MSALQAAGIGILFGGYAGLYLSVMKDFGLSRTMGGKALDFAVGALAILGLVLATGVAP